MAKIAPVLKAATDQTSRRYALAGLLSTVASYAFLFTLVLTFHMADIVANLATLVFGLCLSYVFNRNFVFRHKGSQAATLARFFVVVAIAYGANLAVLQVLLSTTTFASGLAQFLAFSVYTVTAFILHRVWTFRSGTNAAVTPDA